MVLATMSQRGATFVGVCVLESGLVTVAITR